MEYRIQIQNTEMHVNKTTYGPMLFMRVNPLFGQVGEGWAMKPNAVNFSYCTAHAQYR
jgi:hypothetical protein